MLYVVCPKCGEAVYSASPLALKTCPRCQNDLSGIVPTDAPPPTKEERNAYLKKKGAGKA